MNHQNPWHILPHDIYEKHMGHETVKQLEMLSRIVKDQLKLIVDVYPPVVALLGITDGNGLENIRPGACREIIGMDINAEYLHICRNRYAHLPELTLYQIDLMTEKDRAIELLENADLLTANLLIKHIHLGNFIDIISKLSKPVISVTIQFDPDGQAVSKSGYEQEFAQIQRHGRDCDESGLLSAMDEAGFRLFGREEYILPNKKVFIRLDFKRREVRP